MKDWRQVVVGIVVGAAVLYIFVVGMVTQAKRLNEKQRVANEVCADAGYQGAYVDLAQEKVFCLIESEEGTEEVFGNE